MVRHTLKTLPKMLQYFKSGSDHFGTLSMKELTSQFVKPWNYATEDDLARVRKSG